jgi:hypothetical protein
MKQKLQTSLIETILGMHDLSSDIYKIQNSLELQIEKMPDYMRAGILLLAYSFNVLAIFVKFRFFTSLKLSQKIHTISIFKKLPFFKIFFRLFESIIILKALELKC